MKTNLTEIIFILDRSGSMQNLVSDTIGGFNAFIEQQKKEPGEALITTILFDDYYEILHNGVDIKEVPALTTEEYFARGMTAMLDAVGKTINTVGERLNKTPEDERPSKVIFVITTDGQENASSEFKLPVIKEMIERQTNDYKWEFMFLGANIDSIQEAQSLGIMPANAANYSATGQGTKGLYATLSSTIASYRGDGKIKDNWDKDLK